MKRFIGLTLFIVLFIFSVGSSADNMRPASLTIQAIDQTHMTIVWKVPTKQGNRLALEVVFDSHSQIVSPKQVNQQASAYIESWKIRRLQGLAGITVSIKGLNKVNTDVLLRIINTDKKTITAVLNADEASYILKGDITDQAIVSTYITLGIEHILVGFDHLLFVACLVFISRTRKKLLLTITGFTVAHSLTLIMAATGIINIPIIPVEAVIALSIVFLAVEIAKQKPNSLSFKYPVLVSSSFGLLHGFGFASVLAEIGLPKDERISALLCFNIGVEIGQLIFIVGLGIFYYMIKLIKPSLKLENLTLWVSYFSGSVAMIWLMTRLSQF